MEQTFNLIHDFLETLFNYGPVWIYLALIVASFIENIFPPFPGDFFTIAGGALAAAGWLNIFLVFAMVYTGGIGSTMVVYYLGKKYGRTFFMKKNFRFFPVTDIVKMEEWFGRRGGIILVFSRFIVGARAALAIVGGMSRYGGQKFFWLSSISFWIFNGILLFSSYIFVVNFETIAEYFHTYEKIAWPIIIGVIIILVAIKVRNIIRNGKKA